MPGGADAVRVSQVVAVTAALLLATATTAAGPASAVSSAAQSGTPQGMGRCPSGLLCVWTQPGFAGAMTEFLDDGNWSGQCKLMHTPIKSVANLTKSAPWRMNIFLFHNPSSRPCSRHGVYAQYLPGQNDSSVAGGPVTAIEIYAEPNTTDD